MREPKEVIPIIARNDRILGMSKIEWIINAYIVMFEVVILTSLFGWRAMGIAVPIHALFLYTYVTLAKRIEENTVQVVLNAISIPNRISGRYKK
jgi:hypothetical protein